MDRALMRSRAWLIGLLQTSIHVAVNQVPIRLAACLVGCGTLAPMWYRFVLALP